MLISEAAKLANVSLLESALMMRMVLAICIVCAAVRVLLTARGGLILAAGSLK
jgi:hypothetical protein